MTLIIFKKKTFTRFMSCAQDSTKSQRLSFFIGERYHIVTSSHLSNVMIFNFWFGKFHICITFVNLDSDLTLYIKKTTRMPMFIPFIMVSDWVRCSFKSICLTFGVRSLLFKCTEHNIQKSCEYELNYF